MFWDNSPNSGTAWPLTMSAVVNNWVLWCGHLISKRNKLWKRFRDSLKIRNVSNFISTVLNNLHSTDVKPHCNEGTPHCTDYYSCYLPLYWCYPPHVLMLSVIPYMYWIPSKVLKLSPTVLMLSPHCTEPPPHYWRYPPQYWSYFPTCTAVMPHSTEGIPSRVYDKNIFTRIICNISKQLRFSIKIKELLFFWGSWAFDLEHQLERDGNSEIWKGNDVIMTSF